MRGEELKKIIETAFAGTTLGGGISLEQSKVIDNYGRDTTPEAFGHLPKKEVTGDWRKIPVSRLDEADALAHLDAEGFRYYIPALMLRLLENYDRSSMMCIGTLSSLYPKTDDDKYLYSRLSELQNSAIALFLKRLPDLVELDAEDKTIVERALRNHWSKFLS